MRRQPRPQPPGPSTGRSAASRRKAQRLVPRLIAWFAAHARDLPWRRTSDPYAIWVSEIMLQQTQVTTVIPYFNRWMAQLPDVDALANVSSQKLHKLWEGLGYYSRVRHMQQAARIICTQYNGQFPCDPDAVRALPGVGRYTAGAVCSIAFGQPTPILDGNVIRVLTRVFGIDGNPRSSDTNALLWTLAETLARKAHDTQAPVRVGHWGGRMPPCSVLNQSLMELGATQCTARHPRCTECVLRRSCAAYRDKRTHELPAVGARPDAIRKHVQAFVIQRADRYLLVPRSGHQSADGLWEFPSTEVSLTARDPVSQLGRAPLVDHELLTRIRHSITRYQITLTVYRARLAGRNHRPPQHARWVAAEELNALPLSAAHRRIANILRP